MNGVSGVFQLVALASAAWVAAYLLERRGRKGYGLVTGSELILLGVVLGPVGLDLISSDLLEQARPVIILGAGWLGLRFGLRLRPFVLEGQPLRLRMLGIVEGVVSCVALRALLWAADRWLNLGLDPRMAWGLAGLGCATTKSGVAWARSRHAARGALIDVLEAIVRSDDVVAILVVAGAMSAASAGGPALTLGLTLATGALCGALALLVLGGAHFRPEAGWIAALGTCALGDGLASQLGLGAVAVTATCGAVISILPGARLEAMTRDTERPVAQLLLILAGSWVDPQAALALMLALALLRFPAKLVGGAAAAWVGPWRSPRAPQIGFGLFASGGVALGLAFTYAFSLPTQDGSRVISAMSAAILLGDLLGSPILKWVLTREGQLPQVETRNSAVVGQTP